MIRIGVDVGGTKIEVIALDASGRTQLRRRVGTPAGGYEETVAAIVRLVAATEEEVGVAASIGIGTPGSIARTSGLLQGSNSTCLNGRPLQRDLEAALGRGVTIENDANCFALSEAVDGAAAGAEVAFGVILGTGVGAGIVVRGRIWNGRNGIAGEWGHNPLPWPRSDERDRTRCFCGRWDCIETFLSGPAFERHFADDTGLASTTRAIVERAAAGDAACRTALARYQERLARSLAHVVNLLDPDVIVLGGGMSHVAAPEEVQALWRAWIFSDRVDTALVRHRHGDSSGVRGAAWLGAAAP